MDRRTFLSSAAALVIAGASTAQAAEPAKGNGDGRVVELPKPDMKGGKPLMECLALRRTNRTFTDAELSLELLSGLLWSAWGVNRENGKHVIPTAMNYQKLIVFAVRGDGVWQYLPEKNAVKRVIAGDQRSRFDRSGCTACRATILSVPCTAGPPIRAWGSTAPRRGSPTVLSGSIMTLLTASCRFRPAGRWLSRSPARFPPNFLRWPCRVCIVPAWPQ